jgi:UDP-GlcNAc3NAcA epimerase
MTRIATVVGARPQFIKAAVVSRLLRATPGVSEVLIHTGQHYDPEMSEIFFKELSLHAPELHLAIGSGPHGAQTGRMLEAVEKVLADVRPDWVVVYGDTNSTLAGALAAAKLRIPTAHVEAGLRSHNRAMPEEINRVLVDHCSDLLLAPTRAAVENLRREGLPSNRIELVGDVMYDAALFYAEKASRESLILKTMALVPQSYILATVHRAENTDDSVRLRGIVEGLGRVSARLPVVLPLHPRTRAALKNVGGLETALQSIRVVPPVGYLDMILLERNARAIATDSGGVQKEAFFYRVPCVTFRGETEWVETVETGANRLVPADAEQIDRALGEAVTRGTPSDLGSPYGHGDAGPQILEHLLKLPPMTAGRN